MTERLNNDFQFIEVGRKDPKKNLASTISSANNRFKNETPRRYFKTYRAKTGDQFGSEVAPSDGCYLVRVEPPAP